MIFIGTGALGPVGSCQTVILLIMNVLMQGIFVGIAWFNFLEPDVDDTTIRDAFRWRESSGHSLTEYDAVSGSSLAERVCNGDKSLHLSGVQMTLYEDIQKYLKPGQEGVSAYFTGQVLCMVALVARLKVTSLELQKKACGSAFQCTAEHPSQVCWYLMVAKDRTAGFQDVCRYAYRGYIGIIGYILGLYRDNGKENGNYYDITG